MNEPAEAESLTPPPPPVAAPSPGAMLRAARESRGVHLGALAVALKVPGRQLEALESDRLDALPDLTFARALTASVCRHLKTDPAPLLAALPQIGPMLRTEREPLNERFEAPGESAAHSWRDQLARPPVLAAGVLLVAALLLLAFPLARQAGDLAPKASAPSAVPSAASAPEPGLPGLVTESVAPALPGASGPGLVSEPVVPATPAPGVASSPTMR